MSPVGSSIPANSEACFHLVGDQIKRREAANFRQLVLGVRRQKGQMSPLGGKMQQT
jgi:hypothetical protein